MAQGSMTALVIALVLCVSACADRPPSPPDAATRQPTVPDRNPGERVVRISGMIQALQSVTLRVPQISGQNSRVF